MVRDEALQDIARSLKSIAESLEKIANPPITWVTTPPEHVDG